ncbi:MAG: coenzyme A pyrophosphatase [Bacteroidetes bacterium HGW-Bacteroidetes-4]|jgi:8-oxo-dGTP pyrophosphatase MutT (NUDIX family)|nr:MAG: coenzyme A pyrophosphatase [Bacteroidetes bacterium HGW-Bacteroidetes-4]
MFQLIKNSNTESLVAAIRHLLQQSKPGISAQKAMLPKGRVLSSTSNIPPRSSAVLLLLYPKNNELYFPVIRRPIYDGMHSGQMALPGGKTEEGDASLIETAVRESHEEIGVDKNSIEILGSLTDLYIEVTHMQVLPVVGFVDKKPDFFIQASEVDALFEIPLSHLFNPELKKKEWWNLRGELIEIPFYHFADQKVWGATAMILSEFEQLLLPYKENLK